MTLPTKFTAIAIDDEIYALKDIEATLKAIPRIALKATFGGAWQAMEYLSNKGLVDIIFCDIDMPDVNGLKAATILSTYCDFLVFVTGHEEYALKAYAAGVDFYLGKPVEAADIEKVIDKLAKIRQHATLSVNDTQIIFVKDGHNREATAIDTKNIIAICSSGNYVDFISKIADENKVAKMTMQEAQLKFEATGRFIRIHRETIVAKSAIKKCKDGGVILSNGVSYTIGKSYLAHFNAYYKNHLI